MTRSGMLTEDALQEHTVRTEGTQGQEQQAVHEDEDVAEVRPSVDHGVLAETAVTELDTTSDDGAEGVQSVVSSPTYTPPPSEPSPSLPPSESTFTRLVRRPEDISVSSESEHEDAGTKGVSSGDSDDETDDDDED
eukprot:2256790-Karenia_brevis.AAC.1